jgi:hypothetical protein
MVMGEPDHGTNPDAVQPQGSWGGQGQQISSQGKRESVRDDKGGCVRLLPERERLQTRRIHAWTVLKAQGVTQLATTPQRQ